MVLVVHYIIDNFIFRAGLLQEMARKSPNQGTGLVNSGSLEELNDAKLIVND